MKKIALPLFGLLFSTLIFTAPLNAADPGDDAVGTGIVANSDEFIVQTKIVDAQKEKEGSDYKLFLLDGRVAVVSNPNVETVQQLKEAVDNRSLLSFVLKEGNFKVVSFDVLEQTTDSEEVRFTDKLDPDFVLYTLGLKDVVTRQEMQSAFNRQHNQFVGPRLRFRRNAASQCFRRAHVWSYEMEKDLNIATKKVFLMYGNLCMNGWWFHVSPYVNMQDESGKITEMAMDKEFFNSPVDLHQWSRKFVNVRGKCKELEYNQYNIYQREKRNACCHLIKTSRFYFYPTDMDTATRNPSKDITAWGNMHNAYSELYPVSDRRF
ncbi:MAG: hypothetical protein HQK53_02315 [Oligoflexia bacterium]|nr:hypothetical protein [Oligoflexia bacterium]